jgi:hypothetical protein
VHFCSAFTDIGASVTDVLQHNYYPATEGSFTVKFDQSVGCKITKNEIINLIDITPLFENMA